MCCAAADVAARSMARKRLTTARPDRRQLRAAALPAAGLRRHQRLAEQPVHLLDQIPGVLVGHLHRRAPRPRSSRRRRSARAARSCRGRCGRPGSRLILRLSDGIWFRYPGAARRNILTVALSLADRFAMRRRRHASAVLARSKLTVLMTAKTGWPAVRPSSSHDCRVMRATIVLPAAVERHVGKRAVAAADRRQPLPAGC